MEVSRGELIDRYSIERRKNIYGVPNLETVLLLRDEIKSKVWTPDDLLNAIEIATANDSIAVLEWQIRADHKLSDEEIGLRAKEVRKINERRVNAKASIDKRRAWFSPGFETPIEKLNLAIPGVAHGKEKQFDHDRSAFRSDK